MLAIDAKRDRQRRVVTPVRLPGLAILFDHARISKEGIWSPMSHRDSRVSYQQVCGVDVSKARLDVCLSGARRFHRSFTYDAEGLQKLLKLCQQQKVQILVAEATGGLERPLALAMAKAGIAMAIVNPGRIRHFGMAQGQMAKTDPIDAALIASFALAMKPRPTSLRSDAQEKLSRLVTRRDQLIGAKVAEENRLQQEHDADALKSIRSHLRWLERELKKLDVLLDKMVRQDAELEEKASTADAVTGIGRVSAVALVAAAPELGRFSPKQIAALGGLAPYAHDSGQQTGQRRIYGGRAAIRQALYMPTLAAIRCQGKLRDFFLRLVERGKPKMQALVACMRKLLVVVNAKVRDALAANAATSPAVAA